jgi:hypothetical protein
MKGIIQDVFLLIFEGISFFYCFFGMFEWNAEFTSGLI